MLVFPAPTPFSEYYQYKINQFLGTEFYDNLKGVSTFPDFDLKDELVPFFNKSFLLNEDLNKCLQVALDLYYWSEDDTLHYLDNLHLFALYNFLNYIAEWNDGDDYIHDLYLSGKEEADWIAKIWQDVDKNFFEDIKNEHELAEYLHDFYNMIGDCFEDIDFITFPMLISAGITKGEDMPAGLVDDYRDLLSRDILKHYQEIHNESSFQSSLFEELSEIWLRLAHNLKYRYTSKMFWVDGKPLGEDMVHHYIRTILDEHFANTNVTVDHEVDTGLGRIDFRLNNDKQEKVIIEVKLGSNQRLEHGLTKQLRCYMDAENCNNGYYIIICYTEAEIKTAEKIITASSQIPDKNICVKVFDVTRKTSPSIE